MPRIPRSENPKDDKRPKIIIPVDQKVDPAKIQEILTRDTVPAKHASLIDQKTKDSLEISRIASEFLEPEISESTKQEIERDRAAIWKEKKKLDFLFPETDEEDAAPGMGFPLEDNEELPNIPNNSKALQATGDIPLSQNLALLELVKGSQISSQGSAKQKLPDKSNEKVRDSSLSKSKINSNSPSLSRSNSSLGQYQEARSPGSQELMNIARTLMSEACPASKTQKPSNTPRKTRSRKLSMSPLR